MAIRLQGKCDETRVNTAFGGLDNGYNICFCRVREGKKFLLREEKLL